MTDKLLLQQLNADVWHEFRRAYAARDTAAFLAIYHPDVIRAGGPTKEVHDFASYAEQTGEWFTFLTGRGDSAVIDFRFLERIAAGDLASERGIFEITATRADGEQHVFYGKFHTFSRKTEGRWRIAVDYDSDEGGSINVATFRSGAAIDDLTAFVERVD